MPPGAQLDLNSLGPTSDARPVRDIFNPSRKRALACRPLNFLRLSKIDQHPAPGAAQTTPSPLRQWHFIGDREFGSAPAAFHGRHLLPDPQTPALSHRA